jgi:cell division protein FtsB
MRGAKDLMTPARTSVGLTTLAIGTVLFCMGAYFTFAAVQGDFGIFRRVQVEAETQSLRAELDTLEADVSLMRVKTRRLSDGYLDLDLLDVQAREILGLMRADEIIIK